MVRGEKLFLCSSSPFDELRLSALPRFLARDETMVLTIYFYDPHNRALGTFGQ